MGRTKPALMPWARALRTTPLLIRAQVPQAAISHSQSLVSVSSAFVSAAAIWR